MPSQKQLLDLQGNPKAHTHTPMDMVWSREVLSTHSLTGKVSNAHKEKDLKPSLDVGKVSALCGLI